MCRQALPAHPRGLHAGYGRNAANTVTNKTTDQPTGRPTDRPTDRKNLTFPNSNTDASYSPHTCTRKVVRVIYSDMRVKAIMRVINFRRQTDRPASSALLNDMISFGNAEDFFSVFLSLKIFKR